MINLERYFGTSDKILIVPNEMKSYFLEYRKFYPKAHFKLFAINEIFKELFGNFYSKEAIKFGLFYFKDKNYTYSSIKEINEVVFKSCYLESAPKDLQEYEKALKEKGLKVENDDLVLLLKSRPIVVVGLQESSTLRSLLTYFNISNVEYLSAEDVIEIGLDKYYIDFFNIDKECSCMINKILHLADLTKNTSQIYCCLDVNRYEYYIKNYFEGINVPYYIDANNKLIDSKTFKYIYKHIDENISLIEFLKKSSDELKYDRNYETICELFEFYDIDNLPNKKINITEMLSSQNTQYYQYTNDIQFSRALKFSCFQYIFVMGLDQSFMPSSIKDTGLISFKTRETIGLDSFNEANILRVKLEEAFLKQKSVQYITFHTKDSSGTNSKSYFMKLFNLNYDCEYNLNTSLDENGEEKYSSIEYSGKLIKLYYRDAIDKYERDGNITYDLKIYSNYFDKKYPATYSPKFKKFNNFKLSKPITYSYTSIDKFNSCPFAFYCNYILKIDAFEENTASRFGNLAHAILENVYNPSFDFEAEKNKALSKFENKNPFSDKEKALLKRFLEEVKKTADKIIAHKQNMAFKKAYSETNFGLKFNFKCPDYVYQNGQIVNFTRENDVLFTGKIDRIIETTDDSLYLIDYKTGDASFSKEHFINYQIGSQLPAYLTLLDSTDDPRFQGKVVAGMFIHPIITNSSKFYNFYSPTKENIESTQLQGRMLDDFDRLTKFDLSIFDGEESINVDGLKLNKDGTKLNRLSKKFDSKDDFVKYISIYKSLLDKSSYKVSNGEFDILPISRRTNYRKSPCSYCNYKDICLTKFEDDQDE